MPDDRVGCAGLNNTVKRKKKKKQREKKGKRGSLDKQQLHQEVVTGPVELEEGVPAWGGAQWESDRGTKGDQKRLHRFDGCAAVTFDGHTTKRIGYPPADKIEFAAVTVTT